MKGVERNLSSTQRSLKDVNKLLKLDPSNTTLLTQKQQLLQKEISDTAKKLNTLKEVDKQAKAQLEAGTLGKDKYDALQREIIETEQQLKNLKKTAGSGSAAMEKISVTTGKIGGEMKNAGQAMMPVTAALTGLGAVSVNTANDFEDAMSQAAGALDMPMEQMGALRDLAMQTGKETIFSAQEAGQAITELAKGGLTEADIQAGALKATMDLAASSGMELGNAASIVVQAMGAFGLSANDSAQAANALAGAAAASSTDVEPLTQGLAQASAQAKNAGWSIQETTAVLGKFADAGIVGSDAGTSLKTMLQRLAAPTDEAAKKIEELGIQTRDSQGNLLGASDMAEELQNKLGGLSPAARDAALQTIFGSDATRAATIMMNSGKKGLADYIKATNDQEAAQRLANSQMSEGSLAIEEMKGSLETAAITIGQTLAPIITKVAEFVTELANKFSALPKGVQVGIIAFAGVIAVLGPLLMIIGQVMMGISAITGALSLLSAPIATVVIAISMAIATMGLIIAAIKNWGAIAEWFRELWSSVCESAKAIWENVSSTIISIANNFVNSVKTSWEKLKNAITNTMFAIKNFILATWNAIQSNPIVKIISETVRNIFSNLSKTLQGIWNGIKNIAYGTWELIKNVILGPVLLLIDLVTGDFNALKSDLSNIWDNIKNAASSIWNGIKQSISALVDGIKNHISTVWDGIKNVTSEVWNSISSISSDVWNSIKNTISNLVNSAKESAVNGFNALKDGVSNAIHSIPDIVSDVFDRVKRTISDVIGSAFKWGSDFVNGLKDGIMSGVEAIVSTVKGIGDKIRSFLHFSRPDEGPLRDYETWMPDFTHGLAKGIMNNIPVVAKATKALASSMIIAPNSSASQSIDYQNLASVIANSTKGQQIVTYIDERSFRRGLIGMGVQFNG